LAGLVAGSELKAHGHRVVVVEGQPQVGGRLATVAIGDGRADMGAQFFTVRSSEFAALTSKWLTTGVAYEWCRGFGDPPDGYPRYAGRTGMVALADAIAAAADGAPIDPDGAPIDPDGAPIDPDGAPMDVRCGAVVSTVRPTANGWDVVLADRTAVAASAVVLTPPVPLALALVDAGLIDGMLDGVAYEPTLAVGVLLDGAAAVPAPGGVQPSDGPFSFVADNQAKGISDRPTVTLHATGELSRRLWDASDAVALPTLIDEGRRWLGRHATIVDARLVRWPYARPTVLYPSPCLVVEGPAPLIFAGDAFGQARVEGAVLSGLAAAGAVASRLDPP
jgi:predicted NAD/FAD-dependent oxidoreductase